MLESCGRTRWGSRLLGSLGLPYRDEDQGNGELRAHVRRGRTLKATSDPRSVQRVNPQWSQTAWL